MDRIIKRDPRGQGDQGELAAIVWLMERGLPVFTPIGHSPDYDLVTDFGDRPVRIQVKTSTQCYGARWYVAVCTRGGNRSWSGLVKYLNPSSFDYLFVLVGDGRRWLIPAHAVGGTTRIVVGGNKYSEYELSRGQPLRVGPPSLDSGASWRGSRAVKGT